MRGEVINVDAATGGGLISGEDGARYSFSAAAARGPVRVGDRVDFLGLDGNANDVMVLSPGVSASTSFASAPGTTSGGGAYDFAWAMFSFNGRMRRQHYWISWAILFFGGIILSIIPFLGMLGIALLWPNLAVAVKRLHDMGKSGWLIAIPYGAMTVGWIYAFAQIGIGAITNAQAFENEDPATMLGVFGPALLVLLITNLIGIGFWLWMGIQDSDRTANRFGPNPKNPLGDVSGTFM